jgi:hypothetical protein
MPTAKNNFQPLLAKLRMNAFFSLGRPIQRAPPVARSQSVPAVFAQSRLRSGVPGVSGPG